MMKMKQALLCVSLMATFMSAMAQSPDTYWYRADGSKQVAYHQRDVFAFKWRAGVEFSQPFGAGIVARDTTRLEDPDHLSIVEFVAGLDTAVVEMAKDWIRSQPDFECEYEVVSPKGGQDNLTALWTPVNEELMVTFRDPHLSIVDIQAFAQRHNLVLTYRPPAGLPPDLSHAYAFKLGEQCPTTRTTIGTCRRIWLQDSAMVLAIDPNLVMACRPHTNDSLYHHQWYVQNTGQPLAWSHPGGTPDADHDIDWVWAQGYKGQGMRVAVVDLDGYDLEHRDMQGVFVDPWDAINQAPLLVGNQNTNSNAHGMCVAGIIGARANNLHGIAGIAPECNVLPIEVNGSNVTMVRAIQHALLNYNDDSLMVHVMNISMGWPWGDNTIHNAIRNCRVAGRNGKGMVVVASAGNEDTLFYNYPASWDEVIGVVASNPEDQLKTWNDDWALWNGNRWGSSYNEKMDVAAGGALMPTTDHSGSKGFRQNPNSDGDFYDFQGTSGAAPIVAAVCALLIQANPNLVDTMGVTRQVRAAIRAGAEQVWPGVYDYNAYPLEPGRSLEMGFGRLNALRSLALVASPEMGVAFEGDLAVHYARSGPFAAVHLPPSAAGCELVITDLLGRELRRIAVVAGTSLHDLSTDGWPAAIYLCHLEKGGARCSQTLRFIHP